MGDLCPCKVIDYDNLNRLKKVLENCMDRSSTMDHQEKMGYLRHLFPIKGTDGILLPAA